MLETEEQIDAAGPVQPPTAEEDRDLVALLRAGRRKERFYLPTGKDSVSDTYYIELQSWTGSERDQYLSSGMRYEMTPTRKAAGVKTKANPISTQMNVVEQFRSMVSLSVTDFRLVHAGHDVTFRDPSQNWAVFRDLHPEVMDWVRDTIRRFQGIEMTEETEAGEA